MLLLTVGEFLAAPQMWAGHRVGFRCPTVCPGIRRQGSGPVALALWPLDHSSHLCSLLVGMSDAMAGPRAGMARVLPVTPSQPLATYLGGEGAGSLSLLLESSNDTYFEKSPCRLQRTYAEAS